MNIEESAFNRTAINRRAQMNYDSKIVSDNIIMQNKIYEAADKGMFELIVPITEVNLPYLNWLEEKGFGIYGRLTGEKIYRHIPTPILNFDKLEQIQIRWY